VALRLLLGALQNHPGLHAHRAPGCIDPLDLIHELGREDELVLGGCTALDESGAATEWHDRLTPAMTQPQHRGDLLGGARPRHRGRPRAHAIDVHGALAHLLAGDEPTLAQCRPQISQQPRIQHG